jgi:hypothetical protein
VCHLCRGDSSGIRAVVTLRVTLVAWELGHVQGRSISGTIARMRIRLDAVDRGEKVIVRFTIDGRSVSATWRGVEVPAVGQSCDVELDVPSELAWGTSLRLVGEQHEAQALGGVVEDVEGDVVTLRVGSTPVLLDVAGDPPLGVVGMSVSVIAAVEVYPTEV